MILCRTPLGGNSDFWAPPACDDGHQVLRLLPEYVGGQTSSHSQPGSCADEALEVELF